MISYSEYNSLVDVLNASNDNAYEELMQKEKNVLDTVNSVVNHIKTKDAKSTQFTDMSITDVFQQLFLIWPQILSDLTKSKTGGDVIYALTSDNRAIYIGITMIAFALMIFLVESSSPTNIK